MAGVMYLGNQMVSPVILGAKTTYNVDSSFFLGTINSSGVLVESTEAINPSFDGVKDLSTNVLRMKFSDLNIVSCSFPDLETISGRTALQGTFRNSNLEEISMPYLTSVSGERAFDYSMGNSAIKSFSLPNLASVSGTSAFNNTFFECSSLESASFPLLETITGQSAFSYTFYNSKLKTFDMSSLKYVGKNGLDGTLIGTDIEVLSLPNLEIAGDNALDGICYNCQSLNSVNLNKLASLGSKCLEYGFENSSIKNISFPSLNSESFNGYTDAFYKMLDGCTDVTVHFKADLEDIISGWSDVLAGFGGINTTILYDIDPCYVVINVIGTSNYHTYVLGREKTSPFVTSDSAKEYTVYDITGYRVFFGMLTDLVVNETTTFTADVTQATNKVTLATGVSGLTVTVSYLGQNMPLTNDGNGNYFFYTNGTNQEFSYTIGETADTRETSGTFILTGQEQTISVTLTPKQWITFERPNLTADGTMGVDTFAVTSSGCYSTATNRQAFCAVNGNTTTSYYWYSTDIANPIYYFYNKNNLNVSTLSFRWTSTSYRATQVVVAGSNDNSTWENIGTYNLANATTATATINSNTPYNYYRLTFTKGGTYIRLVDLGITGTEYR